MQQLVIKLSPEVTQGYLRMAQDHKDSAEKHEKGVSNFQLDINMAMVAGLCFADIDVNGKNINSDSDTEDLEVQLIDFSQATTR